MNVKGNQPNDKPEKRELVYPPQREGIIIIQPKLVGNPDSPELYPLQEETILLEFPE